MFSTTKICFDYFTTRTGFDLWNVWFDCRKVEPPLIPTIEVSSSVVVIIFVQCSVCDTLHAGYPMSEPGYQRRQTQWNFWGLENTIYPQDYISSHDYISPYFRGAFGRYTEHQNKIHRVNHYNLCSQYNEYIHQISSKIIILIFHWSQAIKIGITIPVRTTDEIIP